MTHFYWSVINFSWMPLAPLIVVAVGAMGVLLLGVEIGDEDDTGGLGFLTIVLFIGAAIAALYLSGPITQVFFAGALATGNYTAYFEVLIMLVSMMIALMSIEYGTELELPSAEYYALIMFAAFGMMLMAASDDLIVIFLGLETMSIAVYALAGFMRRDPRSNEAALKYFLLGAFSTGFLLYGIALIYGATGSIKLEEISAALTQAPAVHNSLLLAGVGLLLIGFGFKVAAVPFHMWTPDAYEGSPTPITGFMAAGVKIAAFAAFVRIFMVHLAPLGPQWTMVLWILAALTMTVGNLAALVQTNVKRMLAYSAIAHAGYVLVGMAAAGVPRAGGAVLYYLLAYAFTNVGAFAVIVALERRNAIRDDIADYRGLARRHPGLAAAMALFMLSLTGVPPLAGFFGKFYIFSAALDDHLVWLVIIAVLNSVASAYYYLGVVAAMYVQEEGEAKPVALTARPALIATLLMAAAGTIVIGLFPQPFISAASSAFASALSPALHHPMVHTVLIH
jgi:NADH-quinone oxidoreductase subunit N